MDILQKRIKAVLGVLFFFTVAQAQQWETEVSYYKTDSTEYVSVFVTPDYSQLDTCLVDFSKSILGQNLKEAVALWTYNEEELITTSTSKMPLNLVEILGVEKQGFRYEIDLLKSQHIPSKAYLNYGTIQIANWQEILFDCNQDIKLHIVFWKDSNRYELGVKSLAEWKLNPSKILPTKTLVQLNKITICSNLASKELQVEMEKFLKGFTYLKLPKELIVIFANDSLPSGGISYEKMAIVYMDAKTSDSNPKFALQHTVLHELFHAVLPYEIGPELEGKSLEENWLAEASPEYFSLRYQLKNKLISDKVFMEQLEQKLRTSLNFDGKSLSEMSLNVYRNASYYDAFYSKGCIALFLVDLKLYEATKGDYSIQDLIFGNYDQMDQAKQLEVSNVMFDLEQNLVSSEKPFALNQYLAAYGWLYQKQIVLPFTSGSTNAEVRKENITPNEKQTVEQKALWEGFKNK